MLVKRSTGGRELQDQDKTKAVREMEQDVSDCRGEREGNTGQLQLQGQNSVQGKMQLEQPNQKVIPCSKPERP